MAYARSANEGKSKCEIFQDTVRDFGLFLYNKEKGEVMGRNGKSWGEHNSLNFNSLAAVVSSNDAGLCKAAVITFD